MISHQDGRRYSFLLGLFILLFTLEIVPALLEDLGYMEDFAPLYWLPVNFYFLAIPILYLYARRLTGDLDWRKDWWHLLLGAVEFVVFSALFLLEAAAPGPMLTMDELDIVLDVYLWGSQLFFLVYAVVILLYLRSYRRRLLAVHSDTSGKWLKWLSVSVWVMGSFTLISFALTLDVFWLPFDIYSIVLASMNALMIYFLTVWACANSAFPYWAGRR